MPYLYACEAANARDARQVLVRANPASGTLEALGITSRGQLIHALP